MGEALHLHHISPFPGMQLSFVGPDLSAGPLPALFYFALSAEESLLTDPYNQPVAYLASLPVRIFSVDLPGHGSDLPATQALNLWAEQLAQGNNIVHDLALNLTHAIEELIGRGVAQHDKIAVAGLSRGGFIAAHFAALCPAVQWILGFAPVTQLTYAKEFQDLKEDPLIVRLNLEYLVDALADRTLRFYIGNLDTRVGTRPCFEFIEKLAQAAEDKRIRSPSIELLISPSIGYLGHGTSKEVFHDGTQWLAEQMEIIDVL